MTLLHHRHRPDPVGEARALAMRRGIDCTNQDHDRALQRLGQALRRIEAQDAIIAALNERLRRRSE